MREKQDSLQGGTANSKGTSSALRGDTNSASSELRAPSSQNPVTE
jgi:hypothetical protein